MKVIKGNSSNSFNIVNVLGVPLHSVTRSDLVNCLEKFLKNGQRGWFGCVNVHAVNIANEHKWFKEFFQKALISYCDGAGVRLGAWLLGSKLPERIALTDWVYDVCDLASRMKKGIFFLGAKKTTIIQVKEILKKRYPELFIAGIHHGYFTPQENKNVINLIKESNADILIVGMGMPLQERWILDNFDKINVKIAFDAGAVFDFIAGEKLRCPKWMGDAGFEWLFRLVLEPRRLWRRYLIGNPLFLIRILIKRFMYK